MHYVVTSFNLTRSLIWLLYQPLRSYLFTDCQSNQPLVGEVSYYLFFFESTRVFKNWQYLLRVTDCQCITSFDKMIISIQFGAWVPDTTVWRRGGEKSKKQRGRRDRTEDTTGLSLGLFPGATRTHDFSNSRKTGKKIPASRAQILVNPTSRVAVKSCFLSRYFAFSRILAWTSSDCSASFSSLTEGIIHDPTRSNRIKFTGKFKLPKSARTVF